jgi:hypothetical protein
MPSNFSGSFHPNKTPLPARSYQQENLLKASFEEGCVLCFPRCDAVFLEIEKYF